MFADRTRGVGLEFLSDWGPFLSYDSSVFTLTSAQAKCIAATAQSDARCAKRNDARGDECDDADSDAWGRRVADAWERWTAKSRGVWSLRGCWC